MVSVQIGNLPISLLCIENGMIAFQPHGKFARIYDMDQPVVWDSECVYIAGVAYEYGHMFDYKNMPDLLKVLKNLKLDMPGGLQ